MGEVKQGGVELHFVPAEPASVLPNGEDVVVRFEAAIGDRVDAVEVLAEDFEVVEVALDALPALKQRFVPRVLRWRCVRAGKDAVAAQAVVLPVEFFGEYQRVFGGESGKVAGGHEAVVGGGAEADVRVQAAAVFAGGHGAEW